MIYKYSYKGTARVHVNGVAGFVEPNTDVESTVKINHPHFEPLFEETVAKEEAEGDTKKKKIKHE